MCEDAYNNTYSCVRSLDVAHKVDLMYCELSDTETFVEVYNLTTDPHQLKNIRQSVDPQVCCLKCSRVKLVVCFSSVP